MWTHEKVTALLEEMNETISGCGVKLGIRSEYAIEYLEELMSHYANLTGLNPETVVHGRGHRKTTEQRLYDKLSEYTKKLKTYAKHIRICGDDRNSYSKTDHDATFMRMNKDHMGKHKRIEHASVLRMNLRPYF